MFDSHDSDFTITKVTPFGRDPLRELADACRTEGIRLGFYYSQFQDWIEPDGGGSKCVQEPGFEPDFDRYFDGKVLPQVRQLLTEYGPICRRLVRYARSHGTGVLTAPGGSCP
jgi:alpha-L-fucosidase